MDIWVESGVVMVGHDRDLCCFFLWDKFCGDGAGRREGGGNYKF